MTLLTLSMFLFFLVFGVTTAGWLTVPNTVLAVLALLVALCLAFVSIGGHTVF
jgi:hypothetical protein